MRALRFALVGRLWVRADLDAWVVADVINVSGHRLSTAEIESALILHAGVAETAGASLLIARAVPRC